MTDMIPTPSPGIVPTPPEPPVGMSPPVQAAQIVRTPGDVPQARATLVKEVLAWCTETKKLRAKRFDKMRADMSFARPGNQWKNRANQAADNQPYEANLVQRHIQQRVSALYAKNPKVVAKRRKRMDFTIWDGEQKSLMQAMGRLQGSPGSPGDPTKGVPPTMPTPPAPTAGDQMLLADVMQGMKRRQIIEKVADTLEILYHYYQNEGSPTFKVQAKQLVRRTETTGVGILHLGFQRLMGVSPEVERRISDDNARLTHLSTLLADAAEDKITEVSAEMEQLKEGMAKLQTEPQIVLREGLVFDFPRSTDVLVDAECTQLRGLVGAKRVAREYHYTPEQIKDIFRIDIGSSFTAYEPTNTSGEAIEERKRNKKNVACVYAVWNQTAGQVYYVCEGYPDFLKEPEGPEVKTARFFPFYFLTFNDLEDPNDIYPPSDVEIIRPMQLEYNRAREGLREHRIANKPGYVASKGMLSEEDKNALANHSSNELIELSIPPDAVKEIEKYIAARPTMQIQTAVYEVQHIFEDIQRVSNEQDANFGGTSGATATESSIAETSRVSALQSNIDDLDDFLTEVARDAGQVLMMEMSKEQVILVAGPGAVWPEMSREQLAQEIYLEVEAGSSGRPNKALEISNWQQMLPYLIQMPNISPDWLARESIKRLDDSLDLADAFASGLPSIVAMNAIAQGSASQVQPSTGSPATDPNAQGDVKFQPGDIGVAHDIPGPKPAFPVLPNEVPPGAPH